MVFQPDPRIAETLARLPEGQYEGDVWKHTLPGQPPTTANTRGARWNPPEAPAVYVAMERGTALAEGQYLVALQPQPIRGIRHIHRGTVKLSRVLDLRDRATLQALGLSDAELRSYDHTACQRVGGTAEWLGIEALIVPSARFDGANLVIFERRSGADFELRVIESEALDDLDTRE